jgi:hypothetical protein
MPIISVEALVTVRESTSAVPARILVRGTPAQLAEAFPLLAGLEPLQWGPAGLVVAPLAGGRDPAEQAQRLAALPLEWGPDAGPAPPLPFPAAVGGGVYRRSPGHAPAPAGVPEVVLVDGDGFGLAEHPTTGMCLDMLALLPEGPALDAGCGSGILALAWARLARGPVLAVDVEPRAVAQARESAWASGLDAMVTVRRAMLGTLVPDVVQGRVVLANCPRPAHDALLSLDMPPPPGLLLSGLQPSAMDEVIAAWGARGPAPVRRESVGRWEAAVLLPT